MRPARCCMQAKGLIDHKTDRLTKQSKSHGWTTTVTGMELARACIPFGLLGKLWAVNQKKRRSMPEG